MSPFDDKLDVTLTLLCKMGKGRTYLHHCTLQKLTVTGHQYLPWRREVKKYIKELLILRTRKIENKLMTKIYRSTAEYQILKQQQKILSEVNIVTYLDQYDE